MDRVKGDIKRSQNGASVEDAENREGWKTLVDAKKRVKFAQS